MPVEPVPCAPGGGGTPGECSCSAAIAASPLCRADGTTVMLVVRSPCADCGAPAPDPAVVGWIDPLTGVFTPGPAPADAGPCETPGCVQTVCLTRCDDTDGDGAADEVYTELWCVRADGTTELVLTYQGDPSVPYTPVAPVECVHATIDCETVQLCDEDGAFLRRYTFVSDGTATYVDVELDGQTPHLVTGPVRSCAETPCAGQNAPVATVGLCLADGTPIAVVITRDCAGTVTRQGWLSLTTGQYSPGAPPAGTAACGATPGAGLAGVLCDTDPDTGEVLGLVLLQYVYAPDGTLASVELLDAATGAPHPLQGELRTCPGGTGSVPEQDLVRLCATDPATGDRTPFLRDYRRDPAGLITGHTDYTLDGGPYVPPPGAAVGPCQDPCSSRDVLREYRCDDTDGDGLPDVEYAELLAVDCSGTLTSLGTYLCDLSGPYAPVAPVDCTAGQDEGAPPAEPCDTAVVPLCDTAPDGTATPFLRRLALTCSGHVLTATDVRVDGTTPYRPTGTVGVCAPPGPPAVLREYRCDDTDGDGLPDVEYTELLAVAPDGAVSSVGTYTCDLAAPYEPVSPVDCEPDTDPGAPAAAGVQARRLELAPGQTWDADDWPTLRSVTAVAHGGPGTVTTADGTSTLHTGESATWSTTRDADARLAGPLTITAGSGAALTLTYLLGVTL